MPKLPLSPSDTSLAAMIHSISGHKVMLDSDLARLYHVPTKRLLEQLRRNATRFPADFAWRLTPEETANLRPQFATSSLAWGGRRSLPWVFTEHGAVMLANVLKSPRAIQASVEIVRAFIRLRGLAVEYRELSRRIDGLEERYDARFKTVFDAFRQLLEPPRHDRGRIGFGPGAEEPPRPGV
jgi:hypothetical protein